MAQTTRQRVIANAGRRRKHKRNAPRHLTAKQIRFFGTPAQKAALSRKPAKRNNRAKAKAHHSTAHRRAVKRNAGEIIHSLVELPSNKNRNAAFFGLLAIDLGPIF